MSGRLIVEKNSNGAGRGCSVAGYEYPIAKLTVLQLCERVVRGAIAIRRLK